MKLPEALVRPGSIVIVNGSTTAASWPGPNPASCEFRVTTTLVGTGRAPASSVAVTRTVRALVDSLTLDGLTLRITVSDSSSSSAIVSVARPSTSPEAVPTASSVSVPSAIESFTGRSVKLPVALGSPAGIVTVNGLTAWKSSPAAALAPFSVTRTGVAASRMPRLSAAVTVTLVRPASSSTLFGLRLSSTPVGTDSSSLIVSVTVPGVRPSWDARPVRMTVSSPSSALSSSGVNSNVAVPLAWPNGIDRLNGLRRLVVRPLCRRSGAQSHEHGRANRQRRTGPTPPSP